MNALKVQITSDNLIATNSEHAFVGAIVYWRLGGSIRLEPLEAAWKKAGLNVDLLPKLPSAQVSMTRAVDDVAKRGRLKTKVKDGGYALIDKDEDSGFEVVVNCRVTLDANDNLVIEEQVNKKWIGVATHPLLGALTASYESHRGSLEGRDITAWLCKEVMAELEATTLREAGGVYFVPRDKVDYFNRMMDVLKSVSEHKIYQVKAMTGDDAVEAVLDAILTEAATEADLIEKAIAQGRGENEGEDSKVKPLGARALEGRADKCREMVDKVRKYEELLGKLMPQITDRLEDLKVSAMEASLVARTEKEEAKQAKKAKAS